MHQWPQSGGLPGLQTPASGELRPREGVYFCHGIDCQFRSGLGTLRKRHGIQREWLSDAEYHEQRRRSQRAHEAAHRLSYAIHDRRMLLLDWLHDLNRLEASAHDNRAFDSEWLEMVYTDRPLILAELSILENASAADVYLSLVKGFMLGCFQERVPFPVLFPCVPLFKKAVELSPRYDNYNNLGTANFCLPLFS